MSTPEPGLEEDGPDPFLATLEDIDQEELYVNMQPGRVKDIYRSCLEHEPIAVTLDGMIKDAAQLRALLGLIRQTRSVHTVSLRFSRLGEEEGQILIEFLQSDKQLTTLYLGGNDGLEAHKAELFEAWCSNCVRQHNTNNGYTFFRALKEPENANPEEDG